MEFHSGALMTCGKQQPGFEGLQLLINPRTGKGYSVTLWDSRDSARAALESLTALRVQSISQLDEMGFISDFVEGFQVLVDEKS